VQDYLPEDHLARFVVDIVEQLDLNHLSAVYSGRGSKPFHPALLVALLLICIEFWCATRHLFSWQLKVLHRKR
jgi:transposase